MTGWLAVAVVCIAAEPAAEPAPVPADLDGWRSVAEIEGVTLDIRYATPDNFTGRVLDGYSRAGAWLRDVPWKGLEVAARSARAQGYTLVVFDAYRPERASRDMVRWAEASGKTHLLEQGYIAARSGHNRGHTVDLTLAGPDGPLDMGTPYDTFSAAAHTANAEGQVAANRALLVAILREGGFTNYRKEWWHFSHTSGPYDPIDTPYGPPVE
jgi:D-alanyl-D-alanine dipeptidase